MKRTVYVPDGLDSIAKERGLVLSAILQAGIQRELEALGVEVPARIEPGAYRVPDGILVRLDGPHAAGVKVVPPTDSKGAALRITRGALRRWADALDEEK